MNNLFGCGCNNCGWNYKCNGYNDERKSNHNNTHYYDNFCCPSYRDEYDKDYKEVCFGNFKLYVICEKKHNELKKMD